MTEEGSGLEKYASMFSRKLKELRGHKPKEEFTRERALEKFRFLSVAGPDGQEPKATFGKGSVLVLSDQERFPPGTILRETYERWTKVPLSVDKQGKIAYNKERKGPFYHWYCLGEVNSSIGALKIFESTTYENGDSTSSVYVFYEPSTSVRHTSFREDKILAEKGRIELTVDSDTSIFTQTEEAKKIIKDVNFFGNNATKIDVMMFGKKVKKEVKEKSPVGLKQLVPQQTPSTA